MKRHQEIISLTFLVLGLGTLGGCSDVVTEDQTDFTARPYTSASGYFNYFDSTGYLGYWTYEATTNAGSRAESSTSRPFTYKGEYCIDSYYTWPFGNCPWNPLTVPQVRSLKSIKLDSSALDDLISVTDSDENCMTLRGAHPDMTTYGYSWAYFKEAGCSRAKTQYNEVLEWWGQSAQHGGIAVDSIRGSGNPDVVLFHIDNPSSGNTGYYRVLWNVKYQDNDYRHSSSTGPLAISGWWGDSSSGAGVAIGDIDGNGKKDLVVVHVDNPSGGNSIYYRIGWNLDTITGVATSWSTPTKLSIWAGSETQGADVALKDLDGDGKLDMIVAQADNPSGANHIYYNVLWGLSTSGTISSTGSTFEMPYSIGDSTNDIGLAIADMNGDGVNDLVVSWVDDPSGANSHYYRVGYSIQSSGEVTTWGPQRTLRSQLGGTTGAAGIAVYDFNSDGKKDIAHFHVDNSGSEGVGYWDTAMGQSDSRYSLTSKNSSKCLDVVNNDTGNGTLLQQWTCNSTGAQQYTLSAGSDDNYNLIGKTSGKCVDVLNAGTANGAVIQLWSCNDTSAQKYSLVSDGAGYYSLQNTNSGKCLDVLNASTSDGATVQLWTCNATDAQKWKLTKL